MRKSSILGVLVLFLGFVGLTSCGGGGGDDPAPEELIDNLQGETFVLGTVTDITDPSNPVDITSDFTGTSLQFSEDGLSGTIVTPTQSLDVTYNVGTDTITISPAPDGWNANLTSVAATTTTLTFQANITGKTGTVTVQFDMVAQ